MFPNRKHLPYIALVTPPLAGVAIGAAMATLFPPQHPHDRIFAWIVGAGGLGAIGLLFGFLAWLWLRGRITSLVAFAAIAIPFCLFAWFINGKGGRWDIAWWFGVLGVIATVAFFARSFALIGDRDSGASGG